MRKKDTDIVYPGMPEGLSVSYTADQGTREYKWQNELTQRIIGGFHQAQIAGVTEGFVSKGDPLKNADRLVIWVGSQPMSGQYQY